MQLLTFAGSLLLCGFLLFGKDYPLIANKTYPFNYFDKSFLIIIGFGPCLTTFILALFKDMTLHQLWGTPLLSLWGLTFIYLVQPRITSARLHRFLMAVFVLFFLLLSCYSYHLLYKGHGSSACYPGKQISNYVEDVWNKNYHTKIKYVIGNRYLAGNVAYFSYSQPEVYLTDFKLPQAISTDELNKNGALLVWQAESENISAIKKENNFKNLKIIGIKDFFWLRDTNGAPVKIGIALLPPLNKAN